MRLLLRAASLLAICACSAMPGGLDAGTIFDAGAEDAGVDGGADAGPKPPLTVNFLAGDGGSVTSLVYSLPFHVRIEGAVPGASVLVSGRLQNLASSATFTAASDGTVDTARDAPAMGDYAGVDPEGLVWGLMPGAPSIGSAFDVQVEVVAGTESAIARLERPGMGTGTTRANLSAPIKGTFWKFPAVRPAVLVLGGSECSLSSTSFIAAWITTLGYHALALDYCNPDGLISQVPLERVTAALDWLAAQPEVDASRLAVFGGSRGGELALQLAAIDTRPVAVVAMVPSVYRWGDTGLGTLPAWTLGDAGLPVVPDAPGAMPSVETLPDGGTGYRFTPMFLELLARADPVALAAATIPVGSSRAKLLLVGAGDDALWPSCRFVSDAWAMLADAGHTGDEQLCLPGAGHTLGPPGWSSAGGYAIYDPGLMGSMVLGGTQAGRGRGNRAFDSAWRAFFLRTLGPP